MKLTKAFNYFNSNCLSTSNSTNLNEAYHIKRILIMFFQYRESRKYTVNTNKFGVNNMEKMLSSWRENGILSINGAWVLCLPKANIKMESPYETWLARTSVFRVQRVSNRTEMHGNHQGLRSLVACILIFSKKTVNRTTLKRE